MSDKDSRRSLYMTTEVATKLAEESKAVETDSMQKKVAEEQEKLNSRRAKQEQQLAMRSAKKADYAEAKHCEIILERTCADLEAVLRLKGTSKKTIDVAKETLKELRQKARNAWDRAAATKDKAEQADARVTDALETVEHLTQPVDPSIIELKSQRLRESWKNSQAAWERIQKAISKRDRDRALKKRVKSLLRDDIA